LPTTKDFKALAGRRAAKRSLHPKISIFNHGRILFRQFNEAEVQLVWQTVRPTVRPIGSAPIKYYSELYCHLVQCARKSSERRPHQGKSFCNAGSKCAIGDYHRC
jgi:hypothetical protein